MTDQDKATPRPWFASPDTNRPDHWLIWGDKTKPKIDVADIMPWAPSGTAEANARLICRAVNSYDQLMKNRKWLEETIDSRDAWRTLATEYRTRLNNIIWAVNVAMEREGSSESKVRIGGIAKEALSLPMPEENK